MDDPIVALSIWQRSQEVESVTKKTKQRNNKSKLRSKDVKGDKRLGHDSGDSTDTVSRLPQAEETDSNHVKRTITDPADLENNAESRNSDSPSHSDNCFPCLHNLELKIKQTKLEDSNKAIVDNESQCSSSSSDPQMVLDSNILSSSPVPKIESYWLLRLFESNLFNMHIAIQYLYSEKDPNVQKYLGRKLMVSNSRLNILMLFTLKYNIIIYMYIMYCTSNITLILHHHHVHIFL